MNSPPNLWFKRSAVCLWYHYSIQLWICLDRKRLLLYSFSVFPTLASGSSIARGCPPHKSGRSQNPRSAEKRRFKAPLCKGSCHRRWLRDCFAELFDNFTIPPSCSASHGRLSSKCNTIIKENFQWSFPIETFSGTIIQQTLNNRNIQIRNRPEIKAFRKEKPDQVVGVLVWTPLPRFMRLGKVNKGV